MEIVMMPAAPRSVARRTTEEQERVDSVRKAALASADELALARIAKTGYLKLHRPGRQVPRVAIAVKGAHAYLVGFTVTDSPAVQVITAEQARKEHIGLARGWVDLTHPEALAVLQAALAAVSK